MKAVTIQVTQEDIDKGSGSNSTSCPIALALQRKFKTSDVNVSAYTANAVVLSRKWGIFPTKKYYRFRLSAAAVAFVLKFDCYGRNAVKPRNFLLEAK